MYTKQQKTPSDNSFLKQFGIWRNSFLYHNAINSNHHADPVPKGVFQCIGKLSDLF